MSLVPYYGELTVTLSSIDQRVSLPFMEEVYATHDLANPLSAESSINNRPAKGETGQPQ